MPQNLILQIQNILSKPYVNPRELIEQLKDVVRKAEIELNGYEIPQTLTELVSHKLDLIEMGIFGNESIKTGFRTFDAEFGGFQPGELIVIGGRPGMGKTQLLVHLASRISLSHPVLYFTYDLPERLLATRFIANLTGIPADSQRHNRLTERQSEALGAMHRQVHQLNIFIEAGYHDSISRFRDFCRYQVEENGVRVIIVDYLQLMSNPESGFVRVQQLSAITRELRNIARDFDVCVVLCSQVGRTAEISGGEMRPMLWHLRECGTIEQDADKVIFIYRPFYYGFTQDEHGNSLRNVVELIVAKNNNGRPGNVTLLTDDNFTSFRDFDNYRND